MHTEGTYLINFCRIIYVFWFSDQLFYIIKSSSILKNLFACLSYDNGPSWTYPQSCSVSLFYIQKLWVHFYRTFMFIFALPSGSAAVSHQPSWSLLFLGSGSVPLPESLLLQSGGDPVPNSFESLDHGETPSSLCTGCFSLTDSKWAVSWSKIAHDSPKMRLF